MSMRVSLESLISRAQRTLNPQPITAKTRASNPRAKSSSKAQLMKTFGASLPATAAQPACLDKYLLTARSASLLLRLAGLDIARWVRADPASDFGLFAPWPSRNVFDAATSAFAAVALPMSRSHSFRPADIIAMGRYRQGGERENPNFVYGRSIGAANRQIESDTDFPAAAGRSRSAPCFPMAGSPSPGRFEAEASRRLQFLHFLQEIRISAGDSTTSRLKNRVFLFVRFMFYSRNAWGIR